MGVEEALGESPYQAYLYSYPHKTAYGPVDPPRPLDALWSREQKDALFLYVHVPFCEQRCGFCNLFTIAGAGDDSRRAYLASVVRQARVVRDALGPDARFARFAMGGGTPTFLEAREIDALLGAVRDALGADLPRMPCSVETSPETATMERLAVLRAHGIDRVSMGVQSTFDSENASVLRRQRFADVTAAVERMRALGFPTVNLDLMYGLPGQTRESWLASVRVMIALRPEEIYLYPLYVRPLTSLGKRTGTPSDAAWDATRLSMYRDARALLLAAGYAQTSMRMFQRCGAERVEGPVYCCQADGMVGLGPGARSYTSELHYSSAFAVGPDRVRELIGAFVERSDPEHARADWGFELDEEDRRRRFVILSLLSTEGLDLVTYRARFGTDAIEDLGELRVIAESRNPDGEPLALRTDDRLVLSPAGIERSDQIGPFLRSPRVRARMTANVLR